MGPDPSKDLIVRARRGDRDAFRLLVESLATYAYALAWRMTGRNADAEDLCQEIFIRLHRSLESYDPSLPFMPWFRTLATHLCLNHLKGARLRKAASLDAAEGADVPAPEEAPAGDFDAKLRAAVLELSEEYRVVLTWLYFEGLGVAEIAAAMKVPTGTVKTWLFRAREELKRKLKPHVTPAR